MTDKTLELAKTLIARFGSFAEVITAPEKRLADQQYDVQNQPGHSGGGDPVGRGKPRHHRVRETLGKTDEGDGQPCELQIRHVFLRH